MSLWLNREGQLATGDVPPETDGPWKRAGAGFVEGTMSPPGTLTRRQRRKLERTRKR